MSRPPKEVDQNRVEELLSMGLTKKEISDEIGVSPPTLRKKVELMERGGAAFQKYKVKSLKARLLMEIEQDLTNGNMNPEDKIRALNTLHKMDSTVQDQERNDLVTILSKMHDQEKDETIDVESEGPSDPEAIEDIEELLSKESQRRFTSFPENF